MSPQKCLSMNVEGYVRVGVLMVGGKVGSRSVL